MDPLTIMAGASVIGSLFTNRTNRQIAQNANEFSAEQYATRYQTTTEDLKAAGLNPMLAYTQGPGNAPTGQIGAPSKDVLGAGVTAYLNARANAATVAKTEAELEKIVKETKVLDATERQINADTDLKVASAAQSRMMTQQIDHNIEKIGQETLNLRNENYRIIETTNMLVEQAKYFREQGKTLAETRELMEYQMRKMKSETKLLDFDIDAAETLGNMGRQTKEFGFILDFLKVLKTLK